MSSKWICLVAGLFLSLATLACGTTPTEAPPPSATPVAQPASTTPPDTPADPTATSVPPSPTSERPLAARVNGEPVYLADYQRELERYKDSLKAQGIDLNSQQGQERVDQARGWILNVMIEQVLTEQAAEQAGVQVSDAQVDQYMQDMVAESGGEEAFRAKLQEWGETYEDARREVRAQLIGMEMTQRVVADVSESTEQVHARHILVDTKEEAQHIRSQLEAGADFAALAKAHSLDKSTRENGGDLGYFPRGILVASEVEEAAFSLQPGQFSEVITSPMGFHIVQVVERDPDRAIGAENLQLLREQAVQKWVESLWSQADVQRFVEGAP
jgi:parvulin-like peptidyl-prolyl isomerase